MAFDWAWVATVAGWSAWLLRKIHAGGIVWRVRDRATVSLAKKIHVNLLHKMRKLAILLHSWDDRDGAHPLALEICNECRSVMGLLLELKANELRCCFKILVQDGNDQANDKVATWVRSEPMDDRPVEIGDQNAHLVTRNSVWSSLLGRSDGTTHWRPFTCFACNNLQKYAGGLFHCDRENWGRYYRSTLVFPIRYPTNVQANEFSNIGFLAFDSQRKGAFRGLPDIFCYRDDPAAYRQLLEGTTAFHIGSIMADTLGAFLRPIYEKDFPYAARQRTEPRNASA